MKRYNLPNKQRNKVGVVLGTDELKGARKNLKSRLKIDNIRNIWLYLAS